MEAGSAACSHSRPTVELNGASLVAPGRACGHPGPTRACHSPRLEPLNRQTTRNRRARKPAANTTLHPSSRIRPTVTSLGSPTTSYAGSTTRRPRSSTTTTPSAASNRPLPGVLTHPAAHSEQLVNRGVTPRLICDVMAMPLAQRSQRVLTRWSGGGYWVARPERRFASCRRA